VLGYPSQTIEAGAAPPRPAGARSGVAGLGARLQEALFRLRPEEAIALAFLVPTTWLTFTAWLYAERMGLVADRQPGGLVRILAAVAMLAGLLAARRRWPRAKALSGLREVLPFVTCILIYTNLHDTIGFVNSHDVHGVLAEWDRALFGVIPCVWAERFVSPPLTELMSFFYVNFLGIAPSVSLVLLVQRRWPEFRRVTLGVIVCFYLGYALYVAFPAAPPRLTLVYEFKRNLQGYPYLMSSLSAQAFTLLPTDSRAAFPSLHTAVSTLVLIYAWRYVRRAFWILLPFVLGLWVSTIYLRHHYVVDLLAGWMLAPVAGVLAPQLDGWWARRQIDLGYQPARGAVARDAA